MSKIEELKADLAELKSAVNNDKTPEPAKAAMRIAIPKIEAQIAHFLSESEDTTPKAEPKPAPKAKPKPARKAEPKPEPKAEPEPAPKTEPKPVSKADAELYWNKAIKEETLAKFGNVVELETLPGTCRKLGITLAQDTRVFVKGDVIVTARKGELVEMVHTGGSNWMQFNIIENPEDKCVKKVNTRAKKKQEKKKKAARSSAVLAEYLALQAESYRIGNTPDSEKVVEVWRKRSGNAILKKANGEMWELDDSSKKLSEYKGETDKLLPIDKSEGDSKFLKNLYGKQKDQVCALDIEEKLQECRSGTCPPEQVAVYKRLARQCKEHNMRERFVQGISKVFDEIFASQRRGQKFEYAYNESES